MQRVRIQGGATAGVALVAAALSLAACSSSGSGGSSSSGSPSASSAAAKLSGTLNGSGSTFQTTFQQTAIQSFKSIQPGLTINYGGGGSGKGRTDLASGVVNYAGSDSPIPSSQASLFTGKTILYFPVVIGPITVSYNLSGVSNLKLDGPVLAQIFDGSITSWNNAAIKAINPGVTLPSTAITIAHRSDSSGTTQNFSEFLVKSAPGVWKLGTSSTINWPAASRGGNGNGGVASIIKSTPGAIGYVDYADAKACSYPITYQSWDLVNQAQSSSATTANLKGYIGYLLGDGQKLLPELNYAPLPSNIDQMAVAQLSKIGSSSASPAASSS